MSTSRQHIGDAKSSSSKAPSESATAELIGALILPVCEDGGYELIEVEFRRGGAGYVLRIYIDFPVDSGKSIGFSDCENLSREISAILDVEDLISSKYDLEVSSPGIERPLRQPSHFRRYLESEVKICLMQGLQGRRNYKGRIVSVAEDDTTITVEVDGTNTELPLSDLASAKLVPDWSALMKGQGKRA